MVANHNASLHLTKIRFHFLMWVIFSLLHSVAVTQLFAGGLHVICASIMTFSTLISLGSVVIALVSLVVSIWKARNAKRALEQSRRFRADALKEATFAKVLEGLQEMMEVVSKLMSERDSISSSIAGNDFRAASSKADPLLKELEALRWKWISLLPSRFIVECDSFRSTYKKWMTALRKRNSEGPERAADLSESLVESRTRLTNIVRETAPTEYLFSEAKQIIGDDKD